MTKEPHPGLTAASTLNEQQEAGARKDAGGFHHTMFVARLKSGPPIDYRPNPAPPLQREGEPRITVESHTNGAGFGSVIVGVPPSLVVIYIEAERWVDARAFAIRKLGVSEADVKPLPVEDGVAKPIPRWQVRFQGTSGHPTDGMRMQARQLQNEPTKDQAEAWWKDVREI